MTDEETLADALQIAADYFPAAIIELAKVCRAGNRQHNGDAPILYWNRSRSSEHFEKGIGHWSKRGRSDLDGTRHVSKASWRALADCQLEMERLGAAVCPAALRAPPVQYGEVIPHLRAAEILRDRVLADDDAHDTNPVSPIGAQSGTPISQADEE
ncbi:hypothetical protein IP90_00961 [Luteimonas cucumeris]|uniref:Uncharacterized protein n=1 Tax=Luteimonas cucumeris TaxID=985012 RepID=A0A562LAY0_9GAMM|nr:hypothetical protein [Luteimonas cucumeris]TWI04823.1 hypothetical protein IP90_00961 [Luteimonas cucumeris]